MSAPGLALPHAAGREGTWSKPTKCLRVHTRVSESPESRKDSQMARLARGRDGTRAPVPVSEPSTCLAHPIPARSTHGHQAPSAGRGCCRAECPHVCPHPADMQRAELRWGRVPPL